MLSLIHIFLSEKQAMVAELTDKIKSAAAGVIVNYPGITVAEDTEMRRKLRESNVDYSVVKNTLLRFAINNVGLTALDPLFSPACPRRRRASA